MRAATGWLLLVSLLCAAGCAAPEAQPVERVDVHAVLGGRLREVMRDLATLSEDRLPQAMAVGVVQTRREEEVRSLALAMADSADAIAAAMAEASLEASELAEAERLARLLGEQARALAGSAGEVELPELQSRVEAIRATCNACHVRFRIPGAPGPS